VNRSKYKRAIKNGKMACAAMSRQRLPNQQSSPLRAPQHP
jgi:hypothetical protein